MKSSQLALIDGSALTEHDVMDAMHGVIVELHQTGDIEKAVGVLNILDRIENVSGLAKAKLLFGVRQWWDETGQSEIHNDTFCDYIESRTSNKKVTINRYLVVQERIENLEIPKEFHNRPVRELIPIAKALEQGYEFSKKDWDELKIVHGMSEVGDFVRAIKDKPARKNKRSFELTRDGTLNGWKNNKRVYIGYLNKDDQDPLVQEFMSLIIEKLNINVK